ncbi:UNVERIFIED_CONTAM: VQ motif-containing protein 4 [Sesamum angustifolium]
MVIESLKSQDIDNPSPPHSNGGSTITANGPSPLQLIPTPPTTPKPISRSHETNPYPTTFVQADTSTFKQVVQMLTGSSETTKQASKNDPPPPSSAARAGGSIPPIKSTGQKKQGFKLYERRNSLKNGLMINTLIPGFSQNSGFSPRKPEILSPSILDFPALVLSPITPLTDDASNKYSSMPSPSLEEEKAIAEKKFYFHPSPRSTPRNAEPQLLPLFPLTSPRLSESS